MSDVAEAPAGFDEAFYLRAHPDVLAAVQGGVFSSGLAHYLAHGRRENRAASAEAARANRIEIPVFQYQGPAPPEALRHRVHGSRDLTSFQNIGKIVAANIYAAIAPQLEFSAESRLFDFGCGCGRVLTYLQERCGKAHYFGTDIDEEAITWCQENLADIGTFQCNEIWPPLPFGDESFDFVFSVSIFTHLPEDMQLAWLAELHRVTKPGGWLVLTVHGAGLFPAASSATAVEHYQRKGFLYAVGSNTDGLPDFYQTAYHTDAYIQMQWARWFEIIRIAPRGIANNQDFVLCRRPA